MENAIIHDRDGKVYPTFLINPASGEGAKRQIAVKDGISDRPYLLTASGSTKAGAALVKCMEGQKAASQ